jgi:hypothetical protein
LKVPVVAGAAAGVSSLEGPMRLADLRHLSLSVILAAVACEGDDSRDDSRDVAGAPLGDAAAATGADTLAAGGGPISLSAIAGRWEMEAVPETGDRSPTKFVVTAADVPRGWTITFPKRPPIPLMIRSVEGDSIVTEAGPYESARRSGIQVRTYGVIRQAGDRLVGRIVAHYRTDAADSVQTFRIEGRRAR